ncbi:MAG: AmmeMemoRadiSam system protein B [Planctomycetota bacterium]
MPDHPLPRPVLRALNARPAEWEGRRGLVLEDPLGLIEGAVFVPEHLVPVLARLDGTRTTADIEQEYAAAGDPLPDGFLLDLLRQLDEGLLLEGEVLHTTIERTATAFLAAGLRPAHSAGTHGYPEDPDACREALCAMLGPPPRVTAPTARGLIAPHIDLGRGADGYAAAYRALASHEPAELFVVLGTGHGGPRSVLTGLTLDWETPLGRMRTDRNFVERVHRALGDPHPQDILLHRDEHSLEFQMLMLAHLFGDRDVAVAGFLCGDLRCAEDDAEPVIAALRDAARADGRRITFIAGADLAHIGPSFGDERPLDQDALAALAKRDEARLMHLRRGDPQRFREAIAQDDNADRVCSTTAIWVCARLCEGPAHLLHYGQAADPDGAQCVSFCGAVFA